MGVRRAVQLAMKTARGTKKDIYTLGPLIHNPQTIQILEERNVKVIDNLDKVKSGILIIRAHGITPEKKAEIEQCGLEYEDATCPLVKRIQSLIKIHLQRGYNIAIIGDRGHSEVVGLMGYSKDRGTIIETEQDIDSIPPGKICVVAQSTQNHHKFDRFVSLIRDRFEEVKVFDTICDATTDRQDEVRQLSQKVEAMIIVGGKNSANTHRLQEISKSTGVTTFLIEDEKELDSEQLKNFKLIGITAGASTPNWVIEKVVDTIRQISFGNTGTKGRLFQAFDFIMKSEIFLGLAAACLYYANASLMDLQPGALSMISVGLAIFALHLLNHYTDPEYTSYRESYKLEFFNKNKKLLIPLGFISIIAALTLAMVAGTGPFIFMSAVALLGLIYSFNIVPSSLRNLAKIARLRDVPASKDVGVAVVWGLITSVYPVLCEGSRLTPPEITTFIFAFTLVFTRSMLLEIRDIQGDVMVGRETVPVIIGKEKTKQLLLCLLALSALLLIAGTALNWTSGLGLLFLLPLGYSFLYLYLYHLRLISHGITWEIITGFNFILTLIIAIVWNILTG
jgi:(E)-4-hydroxy-3-methyl-but-2-enyl pyrophosphate reductase